MFADAKTLKENSIIEAEICIVGSGAAGMTLALELQTSGKSVCLLESGGFASDPETDSLYEFETAGLPISFRSRTQGFGGTTRVWGGIWKPNDPSDFANRPWIPNSGWPISYGDLAEYYERAARLVDAPGQEAFVDEDQDLFADSAIASTIVRLMRRNRINFGKVFRTRLGEAPKSIVYLNAVALGFQRSTDSSSVESVAIKTFAGNTFRVNAKTFVLACGGIENPRLLLLSGLGNEADQVGRFYMDHPKGKVGMIRLRNKIPKLRSFWNGRDGFGQYFVGLALRAEVQERERVLNSYVQLQPNFSLASIFSKTIRHFFPADPVSISLRNFMEQEPHPANRVSLAETRDRFGRRRAQIFWSISELEKKTMRVLHRTLKAELDRLNIGDLESPLLGADSGEWLINTDASHHMGTTRMGSDPRISVVDRNCKVHTVENLYIAGSSVFPSAGYTNPTATIIALAIRLADYLKSNA